MARTPDPRIEQAKAMYLFGENTLQMSVYREIGAFLSPVFGV